MQQPHLTFNWAAIGVSVLAGFVFSALWYTPLFGRAWAKASGLKMDKKPDGAFMAKAMGLNLVGQFLTVYVLAHTTQIWRASVWGVGQDGPASMYGFYGGLFTWIGFYLPPQFGRITWEGKPFRLLLINAGHDFIMLQIIAQILSHWR